jgi:hypothetical protein
VRNRLNGAFLIAVMLAGCASSHVEVVGRTRPAIAVEQVQIYLQPPGSKYEEIANLTASSAGSFRITAAGQMDTVVERLKHEAAKLGANGILLHGVGDQSGRSVGAGVGTEWDSGHSPYGLGIGVFAIFRHKAGDGVAIYVEPK